MRWTTFTLAKSDESTSRVGVLSDNRIHPLPIGTKLIDLLGDDGTRLQQAGRHALNSSAETIALDDVTLLPPIPRPPSIRDFSSFVEHTRAGLQAVGKTFDEAWFEFPFFYFSNPNTLLGDGARFVMPSNTMRMDYELEVCCIIGRECIDVTPEEAEHCIAGYSIFNDWSARDLQIDEMARAPVGPAKGKDSANSLGPFLVTPDEIADRRQDQGYDLKMTAKVNGRTYSQGNWQSVHWSFGEMVSYASRNSRLVPGDVLCSGTVGTGCILELSSTYDVQRYPWLKPGDLVELEVERLGVLRNRVELGGPIAPIRGRLVGARCEAAQAATRQAG